MFPIQERYVICTNVEAFIYAARKYGRGAQLGKLPKGILED